jgi:hypothetical protein
LVSVGNLPSNAEPRVVANKKGRFQKRTECITTLDWKIVSIPFVESHDQLCGAGVICVLNEFLDDRATKGESRSAGHLLQKRPDSLSDVILLATCAADRWDQWHRWFRTMGLSSTP